LSGACYKWFLLAENYTKILASGLSAWMWLEGMIRRPASGLTDWLL
jgi:hypothetical protein